MDGTRHDQVNSGSILDGPVHHSDSQVTVYDIWQHTLFLLHDAL